MASVRGVLPLLVVGASCNIAWRIDQVPPPDAFIDFDTDHDTFLDHADNCPAIANPDQADSDMDGVGDACDPHQGQQDTVVVQELFHGSASEWLPLGAWTMADGGWTSPDPTMMATLSLAAAHTLYRPAIQVGYTIVAFGDPALAMLQHLQLQLDAGADFGNCDLRWDVAGSAYSIVMHSQMGTQYTSGDVPPFVVGQRYVGTYTRQTPNATCSVSGQSLDRPDDVDVFTTTPMVSPIGLQATIDSITVYQVVR